MTDQEKAQIGVYVVMPFSATTATHTEDYWNEHYEHFISVPLREVVSNDSILAQFEWSVKRSSIVRGGPLNYEIIWDLMWSPLVIADLTDLNPNVLYELGIRHALAAARESSRTIMIQDELTFDLPFDFANYAVVKYGKKKLDTWKRELTERLRSCVEAFQYRDNPVFMAFAQHSYSLQAVNQQTQQLQSFKSALDAVERMKNLGFDVKWIQELISGDRKR